MRISRIYQDTPFHIGDSVELNDWAVQHSVVALRLKPGFTIHLFNNQAEGEFKAELVAIGKRRYAAKILEFIPKVKESPLITQLGQGISRGDRMDFALQKAVELGVTEITPLIMDHCALKLSAEQLEKRYRHWHNILVSACEQSDRCKVPTLHPPQSLLDWLLKQKFDIGLVFDPLATATFNHLPGHVKAVSLIIGPEGGLSDQEIALSQQYHFSSIRIGPRILRTETAAIIALSLVQAKWGDLA